MSLNYSYVTLSRHTGGTNRDQISFGMPTLWSERSTNVPPHAATVVVTRMCSIHSLQRLDGAHISRAVPLAGHCCNAQSNAQWWQPWSRETRCTFKQLPKEAMSLNHPWA